MTFQIQELDQAQQNTHRQQAQRMTQVMQKFATLVIGRPIGVKLSDNNIAPAWSTSNTIQFSKDHLPRPLDTVNGVMVTRGLTWHELSHILFTPRSLTDIVQWVQNEGMHRSFNMLEDQRIEMLTVAKYQAVAPWLMRTVGNYILNGEVEHAFPLVYGRKYIPQSVRESVARAYDKPEQVEELMAIINEYLTLTFPSDTERAKVLIARYDELVDTHRQMPHDCPTGGQQSGGQQSRPVSEKKQKQLQDQMPKDEDFDWSEPQPEPADESADSSEDSSDETSGEPTQTPDGQPTDTDVSDSPSDSSDEPSDSDSDSESDRTSDESYAGSPQAGRAITDLLDAINQAEEQVAEEIQEDIQKVRGELGLDGSSVPRPSDAPQLRPELPSAEAVRASVQFKKELQRIKAEHDPAWDYKTRKGRLNAKRYSLGARIDEVFDKFEQGRSDATDIEAVILLDTSGSMDSMRRTAYESMWGIKRALDGIEAKTTVLTFDNHTHVLYDSSQRASSTMQFSTTSGGTAPLQGLRYAQSLLANSDSSIKMLYVITDGAWMMADQSDELIETMSRAGVLTTLAYLDEYGTSSIDNVNSHKCNTVARVVNPADLLQVGKAVVKQAIARNLVA